MRVLYISEGAPDAWLTKAFREAGHGLAMAASLPEALVKLVAAPVDATIIDGVSDPSAWLASIAAAEPATSRVMLAAPGQDLDTVTLLGGGADLCLRRPFLFTELIARLDALQAYQPDSSSQGLLRLLKGRRAAEVTGVTVELTQLEFLLLSQLARQLGRPLPVEQLCRSLWDDAEGGHAETLKGLVHRLRSKLKRHTGKSLIRSRRGQGYYLEA